MSGLEKEEKWRKTTSHGPKCPSCYSYKHQLTVTVTMCVVCGLCSRLNAMGLLVALSSKYAAQGSLFWDDGESFGQFIYLFEM